MSEFFQFSCKFAFLSIVRLSNRKITIILTHILSSFHQ